MSTNRIVILISPIFIGLAGYLATLVAKYFPGHPQLDSTGLADVFIAASLFAAAHVGLWLHGWQLHEARLPLAGAYNDLVSGKPNEPIKPIEKAYEPIQEIGTPGRLP